MSADNVTELFAHGLVPVERHAPSVDGVPEYLFWPTIGDEAFIDLMVDMARLNNYVIELLGVSSSVGEISIEQVMDDRGITDPEQRAEIDFYSGRIEVDMDDFMRVANAASCLVSTYFWFIKTSKDLCNWLEPTLYKTKQDSRAFHRYEFGTIMDILDANTDGVASKELLKGRIRFVLEKVQEVRNDYAHGNWDGLNTKIRQLRMRTVFEAITEFFLGLEKIVEENRDDPLVRARFIC